MNSSVVPQELSTLLFETKSPTGPELMGETGLAGQGSTIFCPLSTED